MGVQPAGARQVLHQRRSRLTGPVADQQRRLQFVARSAIALGTQAVCLAGVPVVVEE
jgi:hypothetical protein